MSYLGHEQRGFCGSGESSSVLQMAHLQGRGTRRYCFGGNRDCGGETWIGLDDSWGEGCARCCAGFGSGVWTGLSAEGEDESF
jgi:hypothetical protein